MIRNPSYDEHPKHSNSELSGFGGNEYINFIENKNDIVQLLKSDTLKTKAKESKKFIRQKHQDFFDKLNNIIK